SEGGTIEQVETLLTGSPEYFQNRGGGTNDGFLDALYKDALNRAVDFMGRAPFDQALAKGISPAQVAALVFASTEFHQDLVQSLFERFLHRPADPLGLNAFVAALDQGVTDTQVIAAIVGSGEYFQRL